MWESSPAIKTSLPEVLRDWGELMADSPLTARFFKEANRKINGVTNGSKLAPRGPGAP